MTIDTLYAMQYQSECQIALKSVLNISKSFEKAFIDIVKLFMDIPNRINSFNSVSMNAFRGRHIETFITMKN